MKGGRFAATGYAYTMGSHYILAAGPSAIRPFGAEVTTTPHVGVPVRASGTMNHFPHDWHEEGQEEAPR